LRLDDYQLPQLLLKFVKSLKKNEVSELITTDISRLHNNFEWPLLNQYDKIKEGDKVSFTVTLVQHVDEQYFYMMKVGEKLAKIQKMKGIAGAFFKKQDYKKAAKIYQKINGYYNFGDATNNYSKEDEEAEEFKKDF